MRIKGLVLIKEKKIKVILSNIILKTTYIHALILFFLIEGL